MGVYVVERAAVDHVPPRQYYDLPDLVLALLAAGAPVGSYPYDGYWLDIGREDDYRRAQADATRLLPKLLGGTR
jgi:NDP-mannose synthase